MVHSRVLVEPLVRPNRLLAAVGAAERARLAPYLHEVVLDSNATLVGEDECARAVWFPNDALLSSLATTHDGHQVEIGLVGNGGAVGTDLLLGGASSCNVTVQIGGSATRIDARDFVHHVAEHDGAMRSLMLRYTNGFLGCVAQVAACNAVHSVDQRLARWLAMARDRTGRDLLPLTHETVAQLIGVRRASVTLIAGRLREAGAIDYVRGRIQIVDHELLEREACDCYLVTRTRTAAVFL